MTMTMEDDIQNLLNSQSYTASSVPQLEGHLLAQVRGETPYMGDSVRRLIKSYQLFPGAVHPENFARACLLSSLEYPNTDMLALSYLIAPSVVASLELVGTVQKCSSLLEACNFAEFWKLYDTLKSNEQDTELAQLAARSVSKVQQGILHTLALCYKEAPTNVVCEALGASSVDAVMALESTCVEKADSEWVTFVPTADNTKRERVYQDSVNFASIATLMAEIAQ